jgi:hypothetical protein
MPVCGLGHIAAARIILNDHHQVVFDSSATRRTQMAFSLALIPQNFNRRREAAANVLTLRRDEYVVLSDSELPNSSHETLGSFAHAQPADSELAQDLILALQLSSRSYGDFWRLQHAA